jgi:hypothetical protein
MELNDNIYFSQLRETFSPPNLYFGLPDIFAAYGEIPQIVTVVFEETTAMVLIS